jgi:hypothetical protein
MKEDLISIRLTDRLECSFAYRRSENAFESKDLTKKLESNKKPKNKRLWLL